MSTVRVTLENNKNNGKDPQTNVTLNVDNNSKEIGTLSMDPKPSSFPKVYATNITHNTQGVEVTFQVGSTNKVVVKAGEYKNISPDGNAVDVSQLFLSAKKV